MSNQETGTMSRPKIAIGFLSILAAFQTVRVFAVPLIQAVLAGKYSEAWLYPAMVDVVVGGTALFIGYALWKRTGLAVWTTAIVWFSLSIVDHLDALTVISHSTGTLPIGFPPDRVVAMIVLVIMSIVELTAIKILTSTKLRVYYLRPQNNKH